MKSEELREPISTPHSSPLTPHYHDRTVHTYESVRTPKMIDWDTQPTNMKRYPHFHKRIPFDTLKDRTFWERIGGVTATKQYPGVEYSLRTVPSAGALYPFELYVQVRNVEGLTNGLYHYETATHSLVYVERLGQQGLEANIGRKKMDGYLFFVSAPWFRTAWKYGVRSFRYCGLDTGHQLGAIEAAAFLEKTPFEVVTAFDKEPLAELFGFEEKEFLMAAAFCGVEGEEEVQPYKRRLPIVAPCDYHKPVPEMNEAYRETLVTRPANLPVPSPVWKWPEEPLAAAIRNRRSIRGFTGKGLENGELEFILETMTQPVANRDNQQVDLYMVVHRAGEWTPGIYKNGELLKAGTFRKEARYLCLEQDLGGMSGATFFLAGKSDDYQALMIQAGIMGHRLYLAGEVQGAGVSGIGAYYDNEVRSFLGTEDWILYALAVGR